jgi:tetratricopeptide (TPR) repeat protein
MLSPVLWTTIATGKPPEQHGIGHFTVVNQHTGEASPVTSTMRRVRAIWDIASEKERQVAVAGWWATWPAEQVRGEMVSDHLCYHFLFPQGFEAEEGTQEGLTHPPGLAEQLAPLVRRPQDVAAEELEAFIDVSRDELDRPFSFSDEIGNLRWALASSDSYRRIGLELWRQRQPDLLMVYIEATDSISHLFGHLFRAGELSGELAEQQRRYGRAVEEIYRWADELVGEYMAAADESTTLVVLSDHGFSLGTLHRDPSFTRDMRRVSAEYHRDEGVLYLWGRSVRPGMTIERAEQLDIAPTLLALLGIGAARDMPGRVLSEALTLEAPDRVVDSFEGSSTERSHGPRASRVDPAILDRLRALGYLDDSESSPQSEATLAALHFEAGRYDEAVEAYAALVAEEPVRADLRTSFAGALGALGRYEEALEQLAEAARLDPIRPETYHNRGVIFERLGNPAAAVEQYRTALRYGPGFEPSRSALARLTGSPEVSPEKSPEESRALELAGQAQDAALHGDYQGALRLLDLAEQQAPELAAILQDRSNVLYLMGDYPAAAEALERALELEPDNALYRTNLERLRRRLE